MNSSPAQRSLLPASPLGPALRYERSLAAAPEQVWLACTTDAGLGAWIGNLRGEADAGSLEFAMNAEGGDAPQWVAVQVVECTPGLAWATAMDAGAGPWRFTLQLRAEGSGTSLVFEHHMDALADLEPYGTGWDYYLDRLTHALAGTDPAAVDWEETNARLSPVFEDLFRSA